MSNTESLVAVKSEVQLLSWAESSTRGRTVTFLLPPDDHGEHPLKEYGIKSGKTAGHRFLMVLVEIDDQEQPVKQEARLSQQAAILCRDRQFYHWAAERSISVIEDEADARNWLLSGARISSRKEFDTNRSAADWLQHQVLAPFAAYRASVAQGVL